MTAPRPSPRQALTAVALCAAAYLYVFPFFPEINNPNENVRVYMTAAIVDDGTYRIDEQRRLHGWVNDAACVDHHPDGSYGPCETPQPEAGVERHYYSVKAPGSSLLGVPVYAAYRALSGGEVDATTVLWLLRVTATVIPVLVFLFFFYRWLGARGAPGIARDCVFLAVTMGSLFFAYALLFVSHTLSAATAFAAFMLLYDARRKGSLSPGRAFAAGLLTAATPWLEYPCLVAGVVLSVYALVAVRPRIRLLWFIAGGLIPTAMMMHFQHEAFGSAFRPGHLMVENAAFRAAHEEGIYGANGFHWDAAWRMLVDLRWGLFTLTPLFLFAIPGFVRLLRRREERLDAAFALALVILMYLVICTMNNWSGGWSVGPRYLAVVVPFVGWAALAGLAWLWERLPRLAPAIALGTTAAALFASGIPSVYYPHIPPEILHPMPELYFVLIGHGFAPDNAANLLGIHGGWSMLPMLALGLGALAWASRHELDGKKRLIALGGALVVGAVVVAPLLPTYGHVRHDPALAFVTRTWSPQGFDRAASMEAALREAPDATPGDYRALADVYFSEGREREARAVIARQHRAFNPGSP